MCSLRLAYGFTLSLSLLTHTGIALSQTTPATPVSPITPPVTSITTPTAGVAAVSVEVQSEALITRGVSLRTQQRDAEALALFEQANTIFPSPRAMAQIAFAEQALNRWVLAERHLREAMAATTDPWIVRNATALHAAIAAIDVHLGRLEVVANVAGAELWISAVRVGTTPLTEPLRLPVGSTPIELRAAGYVTSTHTVDIVHGRTLRESMTLEAVPVAVVSGPVGPPAGDPMAQSKAQFVLNFGAGGGTSGLYLPTVGIGVRYGFFGNRFEMQGRADVAFYWNPFNNGGASGSSNFVGPFAGVDGTFRVRPISGTNPWYAGLGIFGKVGVAFAATPPPPTVIIPGQTPPTITYVMGLYGVGINIETGLLLGSRGQWDLSGRFQLGVGVGAVGYLTLGYGF